jgi:DNA-3-methyladenine glycosylase
MGCIYCLNIVTEEIGQAGAVLIRGLKSPQIHLDGPGKICRYLAITKDHHGISLIDNNMMCLTQGLQISRG